jgi:hypothetical protein
VLAVLVDENLDAANVRQGVMRNEEDLHPAMRHKPSVRLPDEWWSGKKTELVVDLFDVWRARRIRAPTIVPAIPMIPATHRRRASPIAQCLSIR